MVVFFITTLSISILGLVLLISIKHWELAEGKMVGRELRRRSNGFFRVVLLWVESIIPTLVRIYGRRLWRRVLTAIHKNTAILVVRVERGLEHSLYALRHTTDVRRGMGEASLFLREVAEHKRKLLRTERARIRAHQE